MKNLKVTLAKSFEFRLDELEGDSIESKTDDAVKRAKTRLNHLISAYRTSKVLMDHEVTISNRK